MTLILASSSPYRQQLLKKLYLSAEIVPPNIDERAYPNEHPEALARRLSKAKATAVAQRVNGIIIASDQVASVDGHILGKPGNARRAIEQLSLCAGKDVTFFTGLCVYNTRSNHLQVDVVPFSVKFRALTHREIERYVEREQPFDCAGSFKSEGLGICLFESLTGDDPNALIGLPLIRLCAMLRQEGINPLD
ncbi:MAG TPA: nucleoside triphosphate pyrophosphatase [Pseudomonadales bacterium]|nr:nucleoside triphosphate pyrophosphatase [Pseudomonadales bacterium]